MYKSQNTYESFVPGKYPGSSNIYFKDGCPALMNDGRFLTNFHSANEITEEMKRANGIANPNNFRSFMQANGQKFMDAERTYLMNHFTCTPKTACSEGWYNLWTANEGNWGAINN